MSLNQLFANPTSEYRQAPFWFWNHRLDTSMLDWQIAQMREKGLGGFVMHARHGLITPYLSDAWFDCIRFCLAKARALGMVAWAYDERDWPSGPAGGTVIADPAKRMSYIHLVQEEVTGPAELTFGDEVVAAFVGQPEKELKRLDGGSWRVSEGTWRVAKIVRFECPAILWFESYLDTLDKDACQAFIASTYDLHEEKLGDLKQQGLAGFFTDEPALSTYPDDLRRVPWTPSLAEAFERRKGYSLLERLPELFGAGESDLGPQVRYDYWDVVSGLFEEAFFAAIEQWCDKRGLQLIGHPLGEEPLFYQFRCLGNIFRYLKHMHMPGMDHISGDIAKGQPGAIAPKLITSAALLAGRERTMTETFGESGWALTLRDMKWMADWQMVNGINYIIPHAFYYSVAVRRKKDSPPSEFYQAPFWPHYRQFADYTARVTAAVTGGKHVAKVAVFYPMSSVWADFVPGDKIPQVVTAIQEAFAPLGEVLLQAHRDYVIIDEETFATATAQDGKFVVNGLQFEALVVPKMTSIREDALAALQQVAQHCATVVVDSGAWRVLKNSAGAVTDAARVKPSEIRGVQCVDGLRDIPEALSGVRPDVMLEGAPDVYYLHRQKDGRDVYFFINTSATTVRTVMSLESVGRAEIWDPETGQASPLPGQRVERGRLAAPLVMPAQGSCLVVVDPTAEVADVPVVEFTPNRRLKLCDRWWFQPENGNFLTLNSWEFNANMRHKVTELRYTTHFVLTDSIANMRLILDGVPARPYNVPDGALSLMKWETANTVSLNGAPLTEELPWEIDHQFRVLSLGGRLSPGDYTLEILIKNHGWFPQPGLDEYAWLAGDFALDANDGIPRLSPVRGIGIGPWEDQGFPYFSGTGAYYANVELGPDAVGKRLFLSTGKVGDLLSVEVNGHVVGVRPWPPYRVEVTEHVCEGLNLFVLKVSNSMRNMFEGPDKKHPSGLLEEAWLEVGE